MGFSFKIRANFYHRFAIGLAQLRFMGSRCFPLNVRGYIRDWLFPLELVGWIRFATRSSTRQTSDLILLFSMNPPRDKTG